MFISYSKLNILNIFSGTILLLIILFLRIYINHISAITLHFDEAQYWGWSKNLEWGYFSKPPLLAWLIHFNNSLCGQTEFCVRISSPILYFFSSLFIFFSANILVKNIRIAVLSAVAFNLMPGITFSSFISTTDVPLVFFSSIFCFIFLVIYKKKKPSIFYYILLGLVFSLGFLSKYAMGYLMLSLMILLFFYVDVRRKFLNINSIFFIITVLIITFPHFYWNYKNSFVTFLHTADNANLQELNLNIQNVLVFLVSQFIIFGVYPLFFISKNLSKFKKQKTEAKILLIYFFTPIVVLASVSLFSRANANWAVVGFPFGFTFLALLLKEKNNFHDRIYILFSQISLSVLIVMFILIGKKYPILDPFEKQRYTKELAKSVSKHLSNINNVALMADDREDFALMLYYIKDFKGRRAKWNGDIKIDDHYELTTNVNDLAGHNLLFITRTAPTPEMLSRSEGKKLLQTLIFRRRNKVQYYNLYLLKNWK